MAKTTAHGPPEGEGGASAPASGPLGLSAIDRSTLMVTVIGTVMANLISILIIALAYLAARVLVVA